MEDENHYQAKYARALKRNFEKVQPKSAREEPARFKKTKKSWRASKGIADDPTGIGAIEKFLSEQARAPPLQ